MKLKKEVIVGIVVISLFVLGVAGSQIYQRIKIRDDLANRISSMGPESPSGSGSSPQTIQELSTAIATYERQIEAHVRDASQTAVYYKILATRLQDNGLHNDAIEAIEKALYLTPADPVLLYMAGLSFAVMAKVHIDFTRVGTAESDRLYALSEQSYLRAIELNDRYLRPRYGLAILYVFELERPEDAIQHLERILEISRNDIDAMAVLARAFFMIGAYEESLDLYERILSVSRDEERRSEARSNRQYILELIYD